LAEEQGKARTKDGDSKDNKNSSPFQPGLLLTVVVTMATATSPGRWFKGVGRGARNQPQDMPMLRVFTQHGTIACNKLPVGHIYPKLLVAFVIVFMSRKGGASLYFLLE
jgi:hypothetical protein